MADKINEITAAINALTPALEGLARVSLPIIVSLVAVVVVGYLAWKLPPLAAKLVSSVDNNTIVTGEIVTFLRALTATMSEHRVDFAAHSENAKDMKCDLGELQANVEAIHVDMAKEAHIVGIHGRLDVITQHTAAILAVQKATAEAKGVKLVDVSTNT